MHAAVHYNLITIDLDDTVWPCAPVIEAAEAGLYAWLARKAPRIVAAHDTASLRAHRLALMRARPEIAHDLTAVRRDALALLLIEAGYAETLADQAMAVFQGLRNRVEPYADVLPALSRMRRRHKLVSVTNGNARVQETRLGDVFHWSLTAAEAGAAKPAPAMFELAMAWAGAGPSQTLHVGDDPLCDVEAARCAGLAAVWINRSGREWPPHLEPPLVEVRDLHELSRWLDGAAESGIADAL